MSPEKARTCAGLGPGGHVKTPFVVALLALSLPACTSWRSEKVRELDAKGSTDELFIVTAGRAYELRDLRIEGPLLHGTRTSSWTVADDLEAKVVCESTR